MNNKEKTIREWLEELPEPYRTEAINNAYELIIDTPEKSITEALSNAFVWKNSPQGNKYWNELYDKLTINQ